MEICDTKVYFDTEFAAEVYAAKKGAEFDQEFMAYPCPRSYSPTKLHYHIAHEDPAKRRGFGNKFWRCPKCKLLLKQQVASEHKC